MKNIIVVSFVLILVTSACSQSSNDTEYYTGPQVVAGPVSISVVGNSNGEVILSSEYSYGLIGTDMLGVNWIVGFEKTLKKAEHTSYYLYILWESASGSVYGDSYKIGEPFNVKFQRNDWVREIKTDQNGNVIVAVERNKIVEYYDTNTSSTNSLTEQSIQTSTSVPQPTQPKIPTVTRVASVDVPPEHQTNCMDAPSSRLRVGDRAYVSYDPPESNHVRVKPYNGAGILGKMPPGETMVILDGPICASGWVWWLVHSEQQTELSGWTPEGNPNTYWLVPLS